jgi:hypothetical protein
MGIMANEASLLRVRTPELLLDAFIKGGDHARTRDVELDPEPSENHA